MDKVKAESVWDEEEGKWGLPELVITNTKLPPAGPGPNIMPGGRPPPPGSRMVNGYGHGPPANAVGINAGGISGHHIGPSSMDPPQEDRYLQVTGAFTLWFISSFV